MKIRLLNDGGFDEISHLDFPLEVKGEDWEGCGFVVRASAFAAYGYTSRNPDEIYYFSLLQEECEVIEE